MNTSTKASMQKPRSMCLKLSEIRLDSRLQSRAEINKGIVSEYSAVILAGEKFPPVKIVFDKLYYYLVDGYHRYEATKEARRCEIDAYVTEGSFRDALLESVGANAKHGLRRSNEDKRRAVRTLLDDTEWATWSDNQIAKACGVSHTFVRTIRESMLDPRDGVTDNVISEEVSGPGSSVTCNVSNKEVSGNLDIAYEAPAKAIIEKL